MKKNNRKTGNEEMKVIETVSEMQGEALRLRTEGRSIGLVPTMGYFHEGHLSLMRRAQEETDVVVVSLFVNPTQFGADEDLEDYPRDFERDSRMAEEVGVDIIFYPPVDDMYPKGARTAVEVKEVNMKLCGRTRPVHFNGVTTVCAKLFNICLPHRAYFGWKDAQQALILEKMVRDLNFPLEIVKVPTVREEDGVAMSSRNVYLAPGEREAAKLLPRSLEAAREEIAAGERRAGAIKKKITDIVESSPLAKVDYVSIVDTDDFEEVEEVSRGDLAAIAVNIGKARLIDNFLVERG